MIVQWAIKGISGGLSGIDDAQARAIIDGGHGIQCNWWRDVQRISPSQVGEKLNRQNLMLHVNSYYLTDPSTGLQFSAGTPFISLAAGCVERDFLLKTNHVISAKRIALEFATKHGTVPGYLFYCWVLVSPTPAVEIQGVAEEVRELNTYRSWSQYQLQGEITAKIHIPSNQIQKCEKYDITKRLWIHRNPRFVSPKTVSNVREFF